MGPAIRMRSAHILFYAGYAGKTPKATFTT